MVTDLCVLLIDSNPWCSKKTLELLLDAEYRVVTVSRGDEALAVLRTKKRKVDVVLTRTKLPDMCAFKLARILDTKFDVTIIMICDYYHEPTILRGLLSGAMFCYSYPLRANDIGSLWQHAMRRERLLQEDRESEKKSAVADENYGVFEKIMKRSLAEGDSSQIKRHKSSAFGPADGSIMPLPVTFNWKSDLHWKLLNSMVEAGIDVVVPSDVLRSIGSPEIPVEYVNEKLQQYHLYLKGREDLRHKRVVNSANPSATVVEHLINENDTSEVIYASPHQVRVTSFLRNHQDVLYATVFKRWTGPPGVQSLPNPFMAPLRTTPGLVLPNAVQLPTAPMPSIHTDESSFGNIPGLVLPNSMQRPTAPVPSYHTAQSSIHAASSSTASQAPAPAPSMTSVPPVPGGGQAQGEQGVQFRG